MNIQNLGIITLLRAALKDEALVLPGMFDWEQGTRIIYEHQLTGLAVRGASRCGLRPTDPVLRNLTALFCKEIRVSHQQERRLNDVFSLFEKNGITYLPVKGVLLKPFYPQAELRIMGDADVLIKQEQYSQIRDLLLTLGLTEEIESDHEYIWSDGSFKLELHKRLIPSYNRDYYQYYGDGWRLARSSEHGSACYLKAEDHFIYLLVHFAKHYRDGSISAKNICDFYVWCRNYPDMNEAYICEELMKLQLFTFYQNILRLLDTWFEGAEPTAEVDILTETIFKGGICEYDQAQVTASYIRLKQQTGAKVNRRWWLNRIFPPRISLLHRYPVLKKFPALLPFVWVHRGIRGLLCGPTEIKRVNEDYQGFKDTQGEKTEVYEKQLEAVGLGFHFTE